MDVTKIKKKINSRTTAIIAPHIYGLPIDMDPLMKIAKKYKLKVIEDAAQAFGSKYNNKMAGTFGDAIPAIGGIGEDLLINLTVAIHGYAIAALIGDIKTRIMG